MVVQTPKISKKGRQISEILRNLGIWSSKNHTFGQYHNFPYLLHHSTFQNGLIHIFITNINLEMKQNVKCINAVDSCKIDKIPILRYWGIQQNLHKTRIPYFCLTNRNCFNVPLNGQYYDQVWSSYEKYWSFFSNSNS